MLKMTVPIMNVPQYIQDEVDLILVMVTLSGYDVNIKTYHNPALDNFPSIIYTFKKNKDEWILALNFHTRGEVLYMITLKKNNAGTYISSNDLNEDLMAPLKIAKILL